MAGIDAIEKNRTGIAKRDSFKVSRDPDYNLLLRKNFLHPINRFVLSRKTVFLLLIPKNILLMPNHLLQSSPRSNSHLFAG